MSKQEERRLSIRFKGYTEPWEQRKLGEVADFTKGKGYSKGDIEMSGTPIILYGRLYTNYGTIIDNVDTYVTMKEHSVLSEGNEIIVPSSGESSEEISRASVVAKKGVILGGDLNIIRLNSKFSSVFVAITLSNGSQQKELSKRAQGKSVVHLHNSDLKEVNLFYPTLPEQIAIGSFFQELDQLITLQQRELKLIKEGKKTLLSKMFPKDGENFPGIRFPGFTDAWEQRKLGDVFTSFSGGTPAAGNKRYYGGDIPFIRSAEIHSDSTELFLTNEGLENSSAKLVKKGDILYALYGATSGEVDISKINGAINQAILCIVPKINYSSGFIMQWLKYQKKNITDKYLQGGQGNLSGTLVKELDISLPTPPEQRAIGSFFQELDHLITLQQRELEILKTMKSTLLKAMFA
ncbi:restriction endonuclease subunit S [Streptococcus sanguinis]|nr:restriction endonuclease subunit S [Streptococcus sanguinis]